MIARTISYRRERWQLDTSTSEEIRFMEGQVTHVGMGRGADGPQGQLQPCQTAPPAHEDPVHLFIHHKYRPRVQVRTLPSQGRVSLHSPMPVELRTDGEGLAAPDVPPNSPVQLIGKDAPIEALDVGFVRG